MLVSKKKHHFKFKKKIVLNQHILKFGNLGFKLKKTICVNQEQEQFIKLLILKKIKQNKSKKIKIQFYFKNSYSKTQLPLETRMGRGKGDVLYSFGYYKAGYLLFELRNLYVNDAIKLKNYLNKKTSLKFYLIF